MKKQDFKFVLLRAFAHQLQSFAAFVLAYTEERIHPAQVTMSYGTTIADDQPPAHWLERVQRDAPELLEQRDAPRQQAPSLPRNVPNIPEGESINQEAEEMSASSITTLADNRPPAHWLERVQRDAPELLEQPRQQTPSLPRNMPDQPVDIPAHNSELLPTAIMGKTPPEKEQPTQAREPVDQHRQIDSRARVVTGETARDELRALPRRGQGASSSRQPASKPIFIDSIREVGKLPEMAELPGETQEMYAQTRWLSLPKEEATEQQHWEMMRRSWERQQRLDEEQRGVSWSV